MFMKAGRALTTVGTRQPLNWQDMMFDLTPTRSHVVCCSVTQNCFHSDYSRSTHTAMDHGIAGR